MFSVCVYAFAMYLLCAIQTVAPMGPHGLDGAVVKGAAIGGLSGGAAAVSAQQSTNERLSENDRKIAIVVGALGGFQVGQTNPIECVITPKDGPTFFYNNQNGPVILDRPFNISGEKKIN
ncbi:hypothetical protein HRU45_02810 [Candidatus Dependentiae bacterium]|nr:hypothetical protein [Candidatus Dependentiae bacterium]